MQTQLQDFGSFSTGLLADLEMNEQHQNKVTAVFLFYFNVCFYLKLIGQNLFCLKCFLTSTAALLSVVLFFFYV